MFLMNTMLTRSAGGANLLQQLASKYVSTSADAGWYWYSVTSATVWPSGHIPGLYTAGTAYGWHELYKGSNNAPDVGLFPGFVLNATKLARTGGPRVDPEAELRGSKPVWVARGTLRARRCVCVNVIVPLICDTVVIKVVLPIEIVNGAEGAIHLLVQRVGIDHAVVSCGTFLDSSVEAVVEKMVLCDQSLTLPPLGGLCPIVEPTMGIFLDCGR